MIIKLCFLAPSGYGKSTAIRILKKHWLVHNIKIAQPLYELQKEFYTKINTTLKEEQDGELLQFYGVKIRKENPNYLLDYFENNLNRKNNDYDFITNDDCRPYDYERLKDLGFIFIKINGFKRDRPDHTKINQDLKIEWQSDIPYDYVLDNTTDIKAYEKNLLNLIKEVKYERQMLHNSYTKKL